MLEKRDARSPIKSSKEELVKKYFIACAVQGETEKLRKLLNNSSIFNSEFLRLPLNLRTKVTIYHLVAAGGRLVTPINHLNTFKCLLEFGDKSDLLKEDSEKSTILDVALKSESLSASFIIYLLFEIKVPFGKKTLALLNEKYDEIVKQINETKPTHAADQAIQLLSRLLISAGKPQWELKRRADFEKPRLSSLAQIAVALIEKKGIEQAKIPDSVKPLLVKHGNKPASLKAITAFWLKNYSEDANSLQFKGSSLSYRSKEKVKTCELTANEMAVGCSNAINESLKL